MDNDSEYSGEDESEDSGCDDELGDSGGEPGEGGNPFLQTNNYNRKLHQIFAVICAFAVMDDDGGYKTQGIDIAELDETHHKPLHQFILSFLRTDSSFLEATCYDIYCRSFPSAMATLQHEIESAMGHLPNADKSFGLIEMWGAASSVGDGCFSQSLPKKQPPKRFHKPQQAIAIKDKCNGKTHTKDFLLHANQARSGWRHRKSRRNPDISFGVVRTINWRRWKPPSAAILAFDNLLSFKKLNWIVISQLANWTRIFTKGFIPHGNATAELAYEAAATALSWLNSLHGSMLPRSFYQIDFDRMANDDEIPFLFDIMAAGIVGTDGSVGLKNGRVLKIYQSHRFFLEAMANTFGTRYGVNPRVETKPSQKLKHKPESTIHFTVADTEKLLLRVGSFDLMRPDQHIVLMMRTLLENGHHPDYPINHLNKIRALLRNLTSYMKKVRPS
jgi:hypothetical protein